MIFKQYGYSPNNFKALAKLSGLSNKDFYEQNNMSKSMFYNYQNGDTSINWQDWQALVTKYGGSVDAKAQA